MEEHKSFRDIIYTADEEGHRKWVFASKPSGKLYNWRSIVSYIYLIVFFTLPFIELHGEPLFLFNIPDRKFILFGVIFWPQDFFLFALGMLTFLVFIIFFTVLYGRLFCGWVCPQTVFMEMVFRKIEYWIEGTAEQQRKLAKGPWTSEKIFKKTAKQIIFFLFSFLVGNTFLSYIIGVDRVFEIATGSFKENAGGFAIMMVFTFAFYGVFAFLREQVCTFACPYGRLQGVLLDKFSVIVAYDYKRGEPRGHHKHGEEAKQLGDCIDCGLCVRVCPTGIDIRNGTQLECVNCTACIDACDSIMDKIEKPRGLIRYTSENNIVTGEKLKFTPRMKALSIVLFILVAVLTVMLVTRKDVTATVTRASGQLYQKRDSVYITNLYNIKIANKTHEGFPIHLKVENMDAKIEMIGKEVSIEKESLAEGTFFIVMRRDQIKTMKTDLEIGVYNDEERIRTVKASFLGPVSKK
ncbi:MAG TPA: cytochrome c oxidase accessory protein CcoG [Chitinophagales bacterium]|nr:cytochrome c oxidase accessory protein CcoG [Chitinophagales bacterium]